METRSDSEKTCHRNFCIRMVIQVTEAFLMSFGFRDGDRLKALLYPICPDFDGYRVVLEAHMESDGSGVFPN